MPRKLCSFRSRMEHQTEMMPILRWQTEMHDQQKDRAKERTQSTLFLLLAVLASSLHLKITRLFSRSIYLRSISFVNCRCVFCHHSNNSCIEKYFVVVLFRWPNLHKMTKLVNFFSLFWAIVNICLLIVLFIYVHFFFEPGSVKRKKRFNWKRLLD